MLDKLNERLATVLERWGAQQKVQRRLDAASAELRRARSKRASLRSVLEREGADVEALEGLSLRGLFHPILGGKEQQLEKERREYLAAKLRFDESEHAVAALEGEVEGLTAEAAHFGDPKAEYNALLLEKERAIEVLGGTEAQELDALTEQLAGTRAQVREVEEAIAAGEAASAALEDVTQSLSTARGWGAFDMLGGGLITTAIKHSRMGDAKSAAHRAQQHLRRFQFELDDVGGTAGAGIEVEVGGFATFADHFIDGLIVDWIVQSRIVKSLEQAQTMHGRVQRAIASLRDRLRDAGRTITALENQRRDLIERT